MKYVDAIDVVGFVDNRFAIVSQNGGGWKNGKMTARSLVEDPDPPVKLSFGAADPLGTLGPILQLQDVSFAYTNPQGNPVVMMSHVDLSVADDSRISVVGANGAGKSTLLNLIRGTLSPSSGQVWQHHNLKIGYFTQHHVDQLDHNISPLAFMQQQFAGEYGPYASARTDILCRRERRRFQKTPGQLWVTWKACSAKN
jgi:ATPase subunit of ABC transporter with duplicated ATPase domains